MITTLKFDFDLSRPLAAPRVNAVQGDTYTREVVISLYAGGTAWPVPSGVSAAIGYRKSDGTRGLYDKLPDGTSAVIISGSAVTAVFAPQMLTTPGIVTAVVVLNDANLNQLTTFPFEVNVAANPAAGAVKSEDYYSYTTMEEINEAVDNLVARVDSCIEEVHQEKNSFLEVAAEALSSLSKTVSSAAPAIVETARGEVIQLSDASDMGLAGLRIFGKTTQNGTPTPEVPVSLANVGESGSVTVKVIGKNLLEQHSSNWQSEEITNGITYTYVRDSDGNLLYINANGQNTTTSNSHAKKAFTTLPAGTYTVTGCPSGYGGDVSLRVGKGASGTYMDVDQGSGYTFTLTEETIISINPMIGAGKAVSNVKFYPMIRLASVNNDAYEPYVRKDITALTPGGLPGIPVSSGGNYTDSNGKQWICDEVDFEKGVYVQRVYRQTYTGSSNEAWGKSNATAKDRFYTRYMVSNTMKPCLCNMAVFIPAPAYENGKCFVTFNSSSNAYYFEIIAGDYGTFADTLAWRQYIQEHPLEVLYVLAEEKEIPLSEIDPDALAQYATLHTNYPTTTIFNDASAGLDVNYVADTKLYVDNKFAELAKALISNT